jgi:hypothetical protein
MAERTLRQRLRRIAIWLRRSSYNSLKTLDLFAVMRFRRLCGAFVTSSQNLCKVPVLGRYCSLRRLSFTDSAGTMLEGMRC